MEFLRHPTPNSVLVLSCILFPPIFIPTPEREFLLLTIFSFLPLSSISHVQSWKFSFWWYEVTEQLTRILG